MHNIIVHHEQMKDEIHIKIGGESFKACYQVCNTASPKSKDNTVISSLFEANDYRCNMRIGLERFTTQIDTFQSMTLRYFDFLR